MITIIRTANIQAEKYVEALEWAIKLSMLISSKFSVSSRVARNIGGNITEIHWLTDFKSIADFESFRNKVETDREYRDLIQQAITHNLLIGESLVDRIYGTVSLAKL
ncbi:hypothetical protein WSM22_42130 [Cytophagales bacterium WSM2-2]|nr:hypothetical protein WSM22_42130 [Cytophagales bacterium WSM2-2]